MIRTIVSTIKVLPFSTKVDKEAAAGSVNIPLKTISSRKKEYFLNDYFQKLATKKQKGKT